MAADTAIKAIDKASIHRITSGQVVIDLQTAVKELLENSLDAGATNIEVRFKNHGLKSIEVVDNGSGIAEKDFEGIALKHHTSKLAAFEDLTTVRTFGFRGEALSSLCALCDGFTITTATQGPLGEMIEMDRNGKIKKRSKVARQRGTTVQLSNIFTPLPVRRKEFERNAKREFGKALHLLNAYALGPCASNDGKPVKLTVSNQMDKGKATLSCYSLPPADSISQNPATSTAANALARVIDKADFAKMDVVGQFNRGFIIARRRKQPESGGSSMDDLFIVDQHASDEKYNFETLQQTTKIESQRLLRPRPLELTAADEMIARDHLDVLRQNGFEVEDSGAGNDSDGARLRLVAQPVSKSTTFDMRDLEELIHLLQDAPGGAAVRCSKARAMFASRACRKSVMIGMPLTKGQMTAVVQHMGTMDQPWNCPHGRPTMRHLIDLADLNGRTKGPRPIDWASLSLSC
uniref:DNA mismatch repair protein PMS1 n=1 Tax=Schizophyllum commune (strain H4-8 / FGSC 9210) TaxID=578458 RepID=D8Q7M4_SCHCM